MKKEKIKIVELCAGIGCQLRGLENTPCFEPEVMATSEIDIDAIICYAAIHCGLTEEMVENYPDYPSLDEMRKYLTELNIGYSPEKDKIYDWSKSGKAFEKKIRKTWLACKLNKNLGDLSKIAQLPKANLWFISAPCTDISVSGKLAGITEGSGTRSSLVWQTLRLLRKAKETDTLPEYMILENVKNLVGKRFIEDFNRLNRNIEEEFGYSVQYDIMNAKSCGIPQNRERVFCLYIRKDTDKHRFTFPEPFDNGLRLKDVLQDNVDENYYIKTEKSEALIRELVDSGRLDLDKYIDTRRERL